MMGIYLKCLLNHFGPSLQLPMPNNDMCKINQQRMLSQAMNVKELFRLRNELAQGPMECCQDAQGDLYSRQDQPDRPCGCYVPWILSTLQIEPSNCSFRVGAMSLNVKQHYLRYIYKRTTGNFSVPYYSSSSPTLPAAAAIFFSFSFFFQCTTVGIRRSVPNCSS